MLSIKIIKELKLKQIMILVTVVITAVTLLIFAHNHTQPIIEIRQQEMIDEWMRNIFPDLEVAKEIAIEEHDDSGKSLFYKILDVDGNLIGYAAITKAFGYQSDVEVLVGFTQDKKLKEVIILNEGETPGLGSQIKDAGFREQFTGLVDKEDARLVEEGGNIDAISGATVSSKAVVEGVREAFELIDRK